MNVIRLFSLELVRLVRSRTTWLVVLLTALSPAAGLGFYQPAVSTTMNTLYLANPAMAGGAAGGILFSLLTIFELDRLRRSRADLLTDAVVSPLTTALARLLALLAVAGLTVALTLLGWFPVSMVRIGSVFDGGDYALAYLLLMGLALPLSVLAGGCAYQVTCRRELSIVLFAAFAALSLTVWAGNWQLCWLNPCVWALSDDFSNFRIFRSVAWMRLTWLAALAGMWGFSWLCIRRYGKGALGSLARSARRIYRPIIALALLACAGTAYAAQPFLDHSNPDLTVMSFYELPDVEGVAALRCSAQVFPDTDAGTVTGRACYQFENTSGQARTLSFGINPGYTVSRVQANGVDAPFTVSAYQEYNEARLEVTIPAQTRVEVSVAYSGFPQESLPTMQGINELSADYLCLENSALLPRPMNVRSREGGCRTVVEITLPASMTAIPFSTSEAAVVAEREDGAKIWRYEEKGMGSILYAGDYVRQDIEAGGITIQFYYARKHQAIMEQAGAADAVKAVVDYCAQHYGLPAAFGTSGRLKLIQSRVRSSGYAVDGASLLDEEDFTAANLADVEKGGGAGEVMIHELVHQWWGLGRMFDLDDPTSPWSAEGLTVYTTYRIVKELYGEAYAREHYIGQWKQSVDDYYLNFYVRHPAYLELLPEGERLGISNSLSGMRWYSEMPLKILKAEELVGGEAAMDRILYELFQREPDPMYPYLTYEDFLTACGLTEEELELG